MSYKIKGKSHQRSHHVKYVYDERKDHSNDNPYVHDCTPETHIQLTEQPTLSAHEVQAGHNMCIQKSEDGHNEVKYQTTLDQDFFQSIWTMVIYL